MPMTVVTLGPAGTYSHRAARAVTEEVAFRESVTQIVSEVAEGRFDRGVVPIENSIEGSVTESLDALEARDVSVVEELVTPIRHALLARDESFEAVVSHAQALAQCRSYLDQHYPDAERRAVASTAAGVDLAESEPGVAAIAHPDNAAGDLGVVAADIQDQSSNATRFLVIASASERSSAGGKTSLIVYPNANYPGLLLELLESFADREINLSRVESRPSGDRLGDYLFHFDIEAGLYEGRTQEAVAELEEIAADGWVRRLGSYDTRHVVE